jgi:hypothetical protein
VPGTSPGATDSNLSGAIIPAGTTVNSYFLHFDVVGDRGVNNSLEAFGSITFDQPILGLIVFPTSLNDSTQLGLPGVTYASGNNHGLELGLMTNGTHDSVTLSPDMRTVTVDLNDASSPDELRIVTAVPEPASGIMMATCLGFVSLGWNTRVRRGFSNNN